MEMDHRISCEFIVLVHVRRGRPQPVAVAARKLHLCPGDPAKLILFAAPTLESVENERVHTYLNDLFESWREAPADRLDELFEELSGASSDLLRVGEAGICALDDLSDLAARALRGAPES